MGFWRKGSATGAIYQVRKDGMVIRYYGIGAGGSQ
jgi:hypothetical protein